METKKRILLISAGGIFLIAGLFVFKDELGNFAFEELQDRNYWQMAMIRNDILTQEIKASRPRRNKEVEDLELGSQAAVSIRVSQDYPKKVLFEKNAEQRLLIASLTKLMTTAVALENLDLDQEIVFSESAASLQGEANFFRKGEVFTARDLIYSSLMESSNRAAQALAEEKGKQEFIDKMNAKAKELGLQDTYFVNPTGLDVNYPDVLVNYSTALDLTVLAQDLLDQEIIKGVSQTKQRDINQVGVGFHHQMTSTNELLGEIPRILLAKTGRTALAGKCLLLVLEDPWQEGYIINVILDSQDHFGEMRELISWVKEAYRW